MEHGTGFVGQLDGVWFHGRRFDYEPGVYVTSVDGLLSGAGVSFDNVHTGRTIGVLDIEGDRDLPRTITLQGFAYADSLHTVGAYIDKLTHILVDESRAVPFTWTDLGMTRRAIVRRVAVTAKRRGRTRFVDFTVTLRAADQRIYGASIPWSGWGSTITVEHRGRYPAPVTIEVKGTSGTGYTVTGPRGRRLVVTRALASGANHTYDSDSGVVTVSGSALDTGIARADSIELPPGVQTLSVNNGAQLRVRFAETYAP